MTETSKRGEYVCELCKDHDKDFRVPAGDRIGVTLMREHLHKEHPLVVLTKSGHINDPLGPLGPPDVDW